MDELLERSPAVASNMKVREDVLKRGCRGSEVAFISASTRRKHSDKHGGSEARYLLTALFTLLAYTHVHQCYSDTC